MERPVLRMRAAFVHIGVGVAVGLAVAVIAATAWHNGPGIAPLLGWDTGALTYVAWTWLAVRRLGPAETAVQATRDDPGRQVVDVIMLAAGVVSLVAVGFVIFDSPGGDHGRKELRIGLGVLSVIISWAVVHLTYMLRYAKLYYSDPPGGIDFNSDKRPRFHDFAYLAFTIGMTFQVSDTPITTSEIRANAFRHALLSYLFGTVIIAITINLVASLAR